MGLLLSTYCTRYGRVPSRSVYIHNSLSILNHCVCVCLAGKWSEIEIIYVGTLKSAFRSLRRERELVCRYFHRRKWVTTIPTVYCCYWCLLLLLLLSTVYCCCCRCEFLEYLKRPDHKQELLSQWQRDFNSLPLHLRREDAMKAELHCTVDVRKPPPTVGVGVLTWFLRRTCVIDCGTYATRGKKSGRLRGRGSLLRNGLRTTWASSPTRTSLSCRYSSYHCALSSYCTIHTHAG